METHGDVPANGVQEIDLIVGRHALECGRLPAQIDDGGCDVENIGSRGLAEETRCGLEERADSHKHLRDV